MIARLKILDTRYECDPTLLYVKLDIDKIKRVNLVRRKGTVYELIKKVIG